MKELLFPVGSTPCCDIPRAVVPPRYFWRHIEWLLSLDMKSSLTEARIKLLSVYSDICFSLALSPCELESCSTGWGQIRVINFLCEQLSMKQNLICSDTGNVVVVGSFKVQSCFSMLVLNNSVLWSRRAWEISEIMHAEGWDLYSWCLWDSAASRHDVWVYVYMRFFCTRMHTHTPALSVWIDYVTQMPPRDLSLSVALIQYVPEITLGIIQSRVKHPHTDTDTNWKLIGIKMKWCLSNCFSSLRIFSPDN